MRTLERGDRLFRILSDGDQILQPIYVQILDLSAQFPVATLRRRFRSYSLGSMRLSCFDPSETLTRANALR